MSVGENGLELARSFYTEVVVPVVSLPHAACLLGEGSEVLGYDTQRSADHEWGPRVQILVGPGHVEAVRRSVDAALPDTHRGHPTCWFSLSAGEVTDHIEIDTAETWLHKTFPTIPLRAPDTAAWLACPQQHLLQLTAAGAVFCDDLGELTRIRETYRWYPLDVWRWIIAAQWHLIGNTEPLLARTIETKDERGARVLTGRLCRLIMEMAYLQEQRYWPYDKWFGRGFADLPSSHTLGPLIDTALTEPPIIQQNGPLQQALLHLAERHDSLSISRPVTPTIANFAVGVNDAVRPFPVLNTSGFIEATIDAISDTELRNLPRVGTIDQLTHADDQLINFSIWPTSIADSYRTMLHNAASC